MKHKFILVLLIVLFVISTSLCGLGFYYDVKNDNEDVNNDNKSVDNPNDVVTECIFNGELVEGAEYVSGQYAYSYMKESGFYDSWIDIEDDGWGVMLIDKESTAPVTTKLCNSINGKPIVSMSNMFAQSKATEIDLSSFDTSNVTNMSYMFNYSSAKELDLSNFNTSKVTSMSNMFEGIKTVELDLSNFDTKSVKYMDYMFEDATAKIINIMGFDTSNVTDMSGMFFGTSVKSIFGLEKLNTSNVKNMEIMFAYLDTNLINISGFNTKNVETMHGMFSNSKVTKIIGLQNFDTSNVADMREMFDNLNIDELDLSSFDLSNIKTIVCNEAKNNKEYGIYCSFNWAIGANEFFITGNVNVLGTYGMFDNAKAIVVYARTQADADKLNQSGDKPSYLKVVVK